MLPKLDWWPVTTSDEAKSRPPVDTWIGSVIVNATLSMLYPESIDLLSVNHSCSADYLLTMMGRTRACPSATFADVLTGLTQVLDAEDQNEMLFNYTIASTVHTKSISLGWQFGQPTDRDALVYATSPLDLVSRELHTHGNRF